MAVDERERHRFYTKAVEVFGEDEATILMAHLPPGGHSELATRGNVETAVAASEERLRTEIHRVARSQLVVFIAVVGLMNGGLYAALRLA